jgi:signal transduction histidine kinase
VHPDDLDRLRAEIGAGVEAGGTFTLAYRTVRPDGSVHHVLSRARVLADEAGRPARLVGTNRDVTAEREAEEALRTANETLEARVAERTREVRGLVRALTLAEQQERRRIAHVLHDDLQQVLYGAKMMARMGTEAERLVDLLDEATALTRALSHELSPPLLESEDLGDILSWLAEQKRARYGLEVSVEVGPVPVPEADLRILLFQLVRELLFNVVKHAGTRQARVAAACTDGHVRIVVEDEGKGFNPTTLGAASAPGLGIPSVQKRLELVGGRLELTSSPGGGTRITMEAPLAQAEPSRTAGRP